jgi:hypothetical protein
MLPVGEHDLGEVFSFFSKKCEELNADPNLLEKNNFSIVLPQFQVCRDILFLIQDIEKIYHLIEKTGVESNYVLILAAFSKIIDEESNAFIFAINEQDRYKLEAFAPNIAEIIRTRLGSDAGWEPVLHELTRIVRKFNLTSPDQKISQNAIFLLGSAVVAQFDTGIGYLEIQSTLQRYFEESELAEFESLLNKTPYLPDDDTDSDDSINVIFEALMSISRREIDSGSHESNSDPGLLTTGDTIQPISPSVIPRFYEAIAPSGQIYTQFPHKILDNYFSRFDIDISDVIKSLVVLPERKSNPASKGYKKPGMPQYSFMVMGIIILILFSITMAATSGIWNPVNITDNAMGNTLTGIASNLTILQKTMDNTNTENQNNINRLNDYQRSPLAPATDNSLSLIPDQKVIDVQSQPVSPHMSSSEISKNFMRIAFGPDNTIIKKISQDRISLAVTGNYDDSDIVALEQFKAQFNNNSLNNKFTSGIKFGEQADIVMVFLPDSSLKNIVDLSDTVISENTNTGAINYMQKTVKVQFITTKFIYVNSDYKGNQRTHWVLRSLLAELGFIGGTDDYPDSIFYSGAETVSRLSENDWNVVEIMYGKKITPGMSFERAKSLLLV